tara:strand:+ start:16117 stop:17025 length:909 start_codon:yes stop_codon:yes gene_type:complete
MAETYTDSMGNVFPLNAYGRPEGYWKDNKYIFPKFGNQPAAVQPAVEPVQPVVQPTNPYRLPSSVQQQQAQDSAGGDPTQLGGVPEGSTPAMVAASNQGNPSVAPSPTPSSSSLFSGTPNTSINPAVAQSLGGRLGGLLGPAGAVAGNLIGGIAGGRGNRGIAGDFAGTTLGTALLGPLGVLGGVAGGRIGDMKDMESTLALGPRGQRGFWSSLGHGLGIGPSVNQQMEDYYGINQPGIDPFGAAGGHPGLEDVDEDDIGDIDLESQTNPFGDIADAFGQGDDGPTAIGTMSNMGGDQGGWT